MTRLICVLGLFISTPALAAHAGPFSEEHGFGARNIYTFGNGCVSLGSWTSLALEQTQSIIDIVRSLKNYPNCNGAGDILGAADQALEVLKAPQNSLEEASRLESLPTEISSLTQVYPTLQSSSPLKSKVLQALMFKTLENALLDSQVASEQGILAGAGTFVAGSRDAMSMAAGLYQRLSHVLPSLDECAIGKSQEQFAHLLSMTLKLGASFVSSGDGATSRWAAATYNILSMFKNRKFSRAIALLNQTDLWSSMSCLTESTEQAYCSTLDAQKMMDDARVQYQQSKKENSKAESFDSPLAGYYILVRHLPNIAQWLQTVQFGFDPQWITDAQFKNITLDNVNAFLKSYYMVKAQFRDNLRNTNIDSTGGLASHQRILFLALEKLVDSILHSDQSAASLDESGLHPSQNFYLWVNQPQEIPFVLLGIPVPTAIYQNQYQGQGVRWNDWVQLNNFQNVPDFDHPELLADKIMNNLDVLVRRAYAKASAYYRSRIIVNTQNVVTQSLVSMAYNVYESLKYIDMYLDQLQNEILQAKSGQLLIPNLRDIQYKIRRVLESFKDLVAVYQTQRLWENHDTISPTVHNMIDAAYKHALQTAYDEFDVLFQRDTYLTTSLSTLIYEDYVLKVLRKGPGELSQWDKDLLIINSETLLEYIRQIHNPPAANVELDLHNAQKINRSNLNALEEVFQDKFINALTILNFTAENKHPTSQDIRNFQLALLKKHSIEGDGSLNKLYLNIPFGPGIPIPHALEPIWTAWMFINHTDRYDKLIPFENLGGPEVYTGADTGHADFAETRNRLCALILGFENREIFKDFCRISDPKTHQKVGITLNSPFFIKAKIDPKSGRELASSQNADLNLRWDEALATSRSSRYGASDESICAFRNFLRRNQVEWMTMNRATSPVKIDTELKNNDIVEDPEILNDMNNPQFNAQENAYLKYRASELMKEQKEKTDAWNLQNQIQHRGEDIVKKYGPPPLPADKPPVPTPLGPASRPPTAMPPAGNMPQPRVRN